MTSPLAIRNKNARIAREATKVRRHKDAEANGLKKLQRAAYGRYVASSNARKAIQIKSSPSCSCTANPVRVRCVCQCEAAFLYQYIHCVADVCSLCACSRGPAFANLREQVCGANVRRQEDLRIQEGSGGGGV